MVKKLIDHSSDTVLFTAGMEQQASSLYNGPTTKKVASLILFLHKHKLARLFPLSLSPGHVYEKSNFQSLSLYILYLKM